MYAAMVTTEEMCCQKRSAEASRSPYPRMLVMAPERMAVGMVCCSRRTNMNILSPGGSTPSLCASKTTPMPIGGSNTRRVKVIPIVVLKPSSELPGPTDKVPPRTSMTQGTNAAPSMVRLSVNQPRGASSPNKSAFVLGKIPTAMARREAMMGGCIR